MFENKRVFISGGAGVIGLELVSMLHAQGAHILVGDLKPRPIDWPASIRYRQGDLNTMTFHEVAAFGPEIVFHLAATFERSTESYEFWEENNIHNVTLSHHLMTVLKDLPMLRQVVFASSYLIYDPSLYLFEQAQVQAIRLNEQSAIRPRNMCGAAKLLHEVELQFLNHFKHEQFRAVSARIFRSYGKNSRDIISRWIRDLLAGKVITLFRDEGLFDYIFAGDVAAGLMKLAEHRAEGIVNLGTGRARRVSEVVDVLKTHFPKLQFVRGESDIPFEASEADMNTFEQATGWKPLRMLEDTIPEMIAYEQEQVIAMESAPKLRKLGNVLITSVSKKVPLVQAVKRAVQWIDPRSKVFGGDVNPNCIGAYVVDAFWNMPRLDELSVSKLISYCRENEIYAIIPTRDGELAYFSNFLEPLNDAGIQVMISKKNTIEISVDKLLFFEQLNAEFPVIATAQNIADIDSVRFVVKERFGAGSQSMALNVNRETAEAYATSLTMPIFQPFIEGTEYSVDVYVSANGKAHGAVARTRDLIVNGESQITTTVSEPELETLVCRMVESIGIYGHAVIQVLKDQNHHYHMIECNARFGGASTLSVASGLESFYWFLQESRGCNLSEMAFIRSVNEQKLVRFAVDQITQQ